MGLDMYLNKRTYVKNWDFMSPNERHEITITKNGKPTSIKPERVSYITEEVAYWRKANAIHKWFIDNVQDGEDDCKDAYVSTEQLTELLRTLEKVKKNHELAHDLLPVQSGFFFGGTDYDEYYFSYVSETIKVLKELLKEETGDFYYTSSW